MNEKEKQEFERLQAELARLKEEKNSLLADKQKQHDFQVGDQAHTSRGLATIQEFYTEDGVDKVRCIYQELDHYTENVVTGNERLCSVPVETFKQSIDSYWSAQREREEIAKREARKLIRRGESK